MHQGGADPHVLGRAGRGLEGVPHAGVALGDDWWSWCLPSSGELCHLPVPLLGEVDVGLGSWLGLLLEAVQDVHRVPDARHVQDRGRRPVSVRTRTSRQPGPTEAIGLQSSSCRALLGPGRLVAGPLACVDGKDPQVVTRRSRRRLRPSRADYTKSCISRQAQPHSRAQCAVKDRIGAGGADGRRGAIRRHAQVSTADDRSPTPRCTCLQLF